MPNLYNLRLMAPGHFCMAKFDEDFNVAAVYTLMQRPRGWSCDCPAGQRSVKLKPCKHQRMMPFMLGAVNTNRFYEPDSGAWAEPLARDPAVIDQKGVEMTPEVLHVSEKEAEAVIEQSGLTPEEAVYGFTPEPPNGVRVLSLNDPAQVHNAIADAIGEPHAAEHPAPQPQVETLKSPLVPRPASSNPIVTRRI